MYTLGFLKGSSTEGDWVSWGSRVSDSRGFVIAKPLTRPSNGYNKWYVMNICRMQ